MRSILPRIVVSVSLLVLASLATADSIVLHVPATPAVKAAAAQPSGVMAGAASTQPATAGQVDGATIRFNKLQANKPYDISLTLADGRVIQGVNLGWLNEEPVDPVNQPMSDDDRNSVVQLVTPGKDFFNKTEPILLAGDKNRAAVLVRLIRDENFHSDKGGEVIERFDVWYFRFEYGGWEKVQQGQHMLRRDRYPTAAARDQAIGPIRWSPELGGVKTMAGKETSVLLPAWPAETRVLTATP